MSFLVNTGGSNLLSLGDPSSDIALVGEFVTSSDERAGTIFSGAGYNLLKELMHRAGIATSDCYFTNVIKEVVPRNDPKDHFINIWKRGAPDETLQYREWEEILKEELSSISCNVIIAVGDVALWALYREKSCAKWRGSILDSKLIPGKKVIPIINPNSAIRNYLFHHYILFDLKRIVEEAKSPGIFLPQRNYIIGPDFNEVIAYLNYITSHVTSTGADIEITNEELSCMSFTQSKTDAISIPFVKDSLHDYWTPEQELEIMLLIEQILLNPDIRKVWQNGVFDRTFLFRKYGIVSYNNEDTMIAQAVIYPDFPKGLDFITSIYTREPYYKDEGKKYFKVGGDIRKFWVYNAKDSIICSEAIEKQRNDLAKLRNTEIYETQALLTEPLIYMASRGIKVNVKARALEADRARNTIDELQERLFTKVGFELNHNSPKQLKDYFYGKLSLRPYKKRGHGGGGITCDDAALKRISRLGYEEAQLIREIRKHSKNLSTYLMMKLDDDDRIRCSFNPVGTSSLRLSSSKTIFDTGGNMQNLPYANRVFLEADEGHVCFQKDLGQAENRLVAYIAPEPMMIEAFETGKDIHRRTAGLILGKPEDEISDEDGSCHIGGGVHSERFWGKKGNHGLNYDLGYKTFAFYYEIPEADAKFIVDRYHKAYPGVRRYHRWVAEEIRRTRSLTNCHGWRRLFMDRFDDTLLKNAYSFIPQSDIAALLNRQGIIRPYFELGGPIDFLNQVHDSIWFQLPVSLGWREIAKILIQIDQYMTEPLEFRGQRFSIPVDTEMGQNFGKRNTDASRGSLNPKGLKKIKVTTSLMDVDALARDLENDYNSFKEAS